MKELPNPFWATLFLALAAILALAALLHPGVQTVTMAVLTLASNIASGAFGYISGHAAGAASATPTPPADPAQPKK